jgi:hypothetical protein
MFKSEVLKIGKRFTDLIFCLLLQNDFKKKKSKNFKSTK